MSDPQDPNRPTASGLDPRQLDAGDIQSIHEALRLRTFPLPPGAAGESLPDDWILPGTGLHRLDPQVAAPGRTKLRIHPLPKKVKLHKTKPAGAGIRLNRDLARVMEQPVRRSKIHIGILPLEVRKALLRRLAERYGEQSRQLEVVAVYAHLPPEASETIVVDENLRWAAFTWPARMNIRKARSGYYLVVLRDAEAKTRKLLIRL